MLGMKVINQRTVKLGYIIGKNYKEKGKSAVRAQAYALLHATAPQAYALLHATAPQVYALSHATAPQAYALKAPVNRRNTPVKRSATP